MSTRDSFPKARLPNSHYFVTFARGENLRCFAVRPWALITLGALFPLFAVMLFASTFIFVMRDDMLAAIMHRQSAMQVAYEDRLASMRMQLDKVTSNQLLDQNSLEARIHQLLSRQARLETRSMVVTALADAAGVSQAPATSSQPQTTASKGESALNPLLGMSTSQMPGSVSAFAPAGGPAATPMPGFRALPRPGPVEIQSSAPMPRTQKGASLADPGAAMLAADSNLPAELRIGAITRSLDVLETEQLRSVNVIATAARKAETSLRKAIAATGLPADKLLAQASTAAEKSAPGMGGPFVPFKLDPNGSRFEQEVLRVQNHVVSASRLRRAAARLPLGKPLRGMMQITSGFGSRTDPFNGRLAMHTGLDFRQPYGSAVRPTARGTVMSAGPAGGYGNMVEVDHGNGVTSRYAHLSAITVSAGQQVTASSIIGRLGSTGRSTGAHLHYEVRYHEHPLDPKKFLAAGDLLRGL